MKEKIQKLKNNKILKIIGNIIYTIIFIIVLFILIIAILQRTTNNEITLFGYRIFVVATGSMVPEYEVGDVLVSKEVEPSTIQVGDDIVYKGKEGSFKDKIVTHQVIMIEKENENYRIQTKGIANTKADPEITQNEVIGKVIYKMGILSLLQRAMSNNYVFYFVVFVPIVLLTFRQILKSRLDDDEDDEDQENDEDEKDRDKKHKNNDKNSNKEKTNKKS